MQNLINKIHLGDCMEFMKKLPDKCIDLVLTDPPYGIGADKGTNGFGVAKVRKYKGAWDKKTPAKKYFQEMLRISKKQIIFGGNYFADCLPVSKSWLIWDKVGEYGFCNPFADCELAWTNNTKATKKYTCIQQGFINENKNEYRIHPTQKPLALWESIMLDFTETNDLILDPFSGSGTTAIAAHRLGRRFICVERDPEYHAASVARLNDEKKQLRFDF